MTRFGCISLTLGQFARELAEFRAPAAPGFRAAETLGNVQLVATRPSKRAAAQCQNRYPSPSLRSDLSRVRPHLSLTHRAAGAHVALAPHGRPFAHHGNLGGIYFASRAKGAKTETIIISEKGSQKCKRNPGSSALSPCLASRPVWTMTSSAALLARPAARCLPTRLAAMRLLAPSSVAGSASSATISAHVTNAFRGAHARPDTHEHEKVAWRVAPGGLFSCHSPRAKEESRGAAYQKGTADV